MTEIHNKARIRWACRRGMLELDVLFMPFVDEAFDSLSVQQQAVLQRLLEADDPDLFVWFMGHQECKDPELKQMVQLILDRVRV
ncbi:succinate dehydrogenase assembly factor 2 [Pseudoalteromonas sp. SG44-1]|uniref:FAD assembly factor SdhE n=1 Tax=Pseudoalteromonas sp. SG44-1 TaxID=2760964 RepID=UPI0015FFBC46|nr:succinate dehydrogenase assembly factor 2 [Pseudoalteromonas sp. SG44-1]MBB1415679.1 succinate dehydrogenase assembly factor 2 [Pseudoalteromonas sp. SG44-1]